MADKIQFRRDTAARWASVNPLLLEGEIGVVLDNPNQYKVGDGVHYWNDLPLRGFNGNIVNQKGQSEESVMSQKAVTNFIDSNTAYLYCTSNAGDDKVVQNTGFDINNGIRLLIKMQYANTKTSDVTLQVGTTDAKPIIYNGAAVTNENTWDANDVLDVYYDGANYQACLHGSTQFATGEKVSDVSIDNEPTAESENLVKSGGLYNKFKTIEEELGASIATTIEEDVSATWINNGYICYRTIATYNEGQMYSSASSLYSDFIDVSRYRMLKYINMKTTTPAQSILAGVCFYTEPNEASVISGTGIAYAHDDSENSFYENEITIPAGAKYVRFSCFAEFINNFYCKGIYNDYVYSSGLGKEVQDISEDIQVIQSITNTLEDKVDTLEDEVGTAEETTIEEDVSATWINNGYICYRDDFQVQGYFEGDIYSSNSSKYSNFIDISRYTALKYTRMIVPTSTQNIVAGLCFYSDANVESVISGSGQGYMHGDSDNFYEETISVPAGAKYVRFSCRNIFIDDFYCKGVYNDYIYSDGLGKKVQDISEDVETIKETLDQQEIRINPVLCRKRFYLAMTEWCKNHNLSDSVIIEGAGGGGVGGEVEDEQLGHGLAQYKVGDAAKILFNAYSYDFIANALCEKVHIAYPKDVPEGIELISTSYDSFESVLPDYIPMVWKTGSGAKNVDIMDENYYNLCAICNSEDFNGNLVLGVIRSASNDREKRYIMFKALMDIAKKLINNDESISAEEETLINNGKGTNLNGDDVLGNAIAIKVPVGNPKAFHKIDFNDVDNPYIIYTNNASVPIKTMSMIKLLTAIIVLDYIKDLDVHLTVTAEDRASAGPTSSAYNLLPEGSKITIRDLIYAALLPSSNVACYVLARYVGQFLIETYGSNGFIPDTELNN